LLVFIFWKNGSQAQKTEKLARREIKFEWIIVKPGGPLLRHPAGPVLKENQSQF
jgi:hypothetical protein